ncbi:MAG: methyl-accepting chemotaxis protein [Pontixanthobacter sp.]
MDNVALRENDGESIDRIPDSCGAVTVGCAEVAGIVQSVIDSSSRLREEHRTLAGTVSKLEADQRQVSEASDEARLLSERAIERLGQGTDLIQSSLRQITDLLELVETLTQHITGFAGAMQQVRRSALDIEQIAETTNILALNATIEAMRAGDAGRTFAVVAGEVKSLAGETRRATEEIGKTIDTLGREAEQVIEQIETGAEASRNAKSSVAQIEQTIEGVAELVEEVDRQNDQIARSTGTISGHVGDVQDVLSSFDRAARHNETKLETAHGQMAELEITASGMFDAVVKAGLAPSDSLMVDRARELASEITRIAEQGVVTGAVTMDQLFDTDYRPIADSNPIRYRTTLNDWADRNWRPFGDRVLAQEPGIMMVTQSDMNGYLPTHVSDYSHAPNGDLTHDTRFCRNGRILFDGQDEKAKSSNDAYMMAVYRQEGDGRQHVVVRNVFVPLYIKGRRWGDFELAYTFDC